MTVLSGWSADTYNNATLLTQMQKFYEQRATQQTNMITNRYDSEINAVNLEADRWRTVREGLQDARSVISEATSRAKSIRDTIENMILAVNKAGQNDDDVLGSEVYAASFDSYLRGIDSSAKGGTQSPNLLGVAKQELTYRAGINGTTVTVDSAYVGSDYYIIDSDGKYWDLDRQAKILKQYDVYPDEPTGKAGNFETGLTLDSLSGDDITFTMAPDTATPETISGTLYRQGLHILDSWAYEGLSTEAGRQAALDDLKTAQASIDLEVRRYEVAFTTVNYYEEIATQSITGLRKETDQFQIDKAIEINQAQEQLARDYQTANNSVALSLSMQNQYAKMLNPLFENKFANALLNILA
ncbi:MAG: hypothetical protein MI741_13850 [Rhodospirillales bacterium]|nr:hypothetical protein [Rhodospirillales bacterium]